MTRIPEQAVKAACEAVLRQRRGTHPNVEWPPLTLEERWEVEAALTAALPFLAPQPSQSDDERATSMLFGPDYVAKQPIDPDMNCTIRYGFLVDHLAAVRAEATRAERDACAKVADGFTLEANQGRNRFKVHESWRDDQSPSDVFNLGSDDAGTYIAADIRERKP